MTNLTPERMEVIRKVVETCSMVRVELLGELLAEVERLRVRAETFKAQRDAEIERVKSLDSEVSALKDRINEVMKYGTHHLAGLACDDCGRAYGDEFGFPDMLVPDDVWETIAPERDGRGLLCPSCIVRRCHHVGIECDARFTSGPFSVHRDKEHGDD